MNIITLGYSNIGKTYFLGSLFKMSFELCGKGFSLQHRNFKELGNIEDVFTVISGNRKGMVPSSKKLKTSDMLLSQGFTTVVEDVKLIDIEGQAMVPGQNSDVAGEIEESIKGCDGLFLVLQSPKNIQETEESQKQLAQMINFSKEVLSQNRGIPIALILNKIDALPEAKDIAENLGKEEEKMEKDLRQSKNLPVYEIDKIMESQRGQILGRLVRPAVETRWNCRLIRQFFTWISASGGQIPNRVFPCTTLGFGNTAENLHGNGTLVANQIGTLKPYGTAASFLWLVYARLQSQNSGIESLLKPDRVCNDLGEDIRELHTSGRAYFDNESKLWNLRDVTGLYHHNLMD